MPKSSLFQKSLTKIWDTYSKDVGKSLIHLGAVGWIFGALAQIGALAFNKKIDKEEKNFLFPQEIADGIINVGLYYTICQGIKSFADKCVDKGKFIPEFVHSAYEKLTANKNLFLGLCLVFFLPFGYPVYFYPCKLQFHLSHVYILAQTG